MPRYLVQTEERYGLVDQGEIPTGCMPVMKQTFWGRYEINVDWMPIVLTPIHLIEEMAENRAYVQLQKRAREEYPGEQFYFKVEVMWIKELSEPTKMFP